MPYRQVKGPEDLERFLLENQGIEEYDVWGEQFKELTLHKFFEDGGELAIIDTGTQHSMPRVLETIAALGASPEQVRYVMPTHVHLDHAGGSGQLMQTCPNAALVVHPKGLPHMLDPSRLQAGAIEVYGEAAFRRDFGELVPIPEERTIAAADLQIVQTLPESLSDLNRQTDRVPLLGRCRPGCRRRQPRPWTKRT